MSPVFAWKGSNSVCEMINGRIDIARDVGCGRLSERVAEQGILAQ